MKNPTKHGQGNAPVGDRGMPLTAAPELATVVVESLEGGHAFCARVLAMGLAPGTEAVVLQNHGRCPVMLRVRDTQLAIGRGAANRIRVRVKPSADSADGHAG